MSFPSFLPPLEFPTRLLLDLSPSLEETLLSPEHVLLSPDHMSRGEQLLQLLPGKLTSSRFIGNAGDRYHRSTLLSFGPRCPNGRVSQGQLSILQVRKLHL